MDQGYEQDILCQLQVNRNFLKINFTSPIVIWNQHKPFCRSCVQNFQATLHDKEVQLNVCEQRLEIRDNQVRELQREVESLKKDVVECLKQQGEAEVETRDHLLLQLDDKKREVEALNRELNKRTINLQVSQSYGLTS